MNTDKAEEATTHTFTFTIHTADPIPPNDKIYGRFDWEGDGIWDTPFSEDLEIHHRYFVPGTYLPKVECITLSGHSQSDSLEILVHQGYSPPKAKFSNQPATGHFKTEFLFDASLTKDDEDSLQDLQFRWDMLNDGNWETNYTSSTIPEDINEARTDVFTIKLNRDDPNLWTGPFGNRFYMPVRCVKD